MSSTANRNDHLSRGIRFRLIHEGCPNPPTCRCCCAGANAPWISEMEDSRFGRQDPRDRSINSRHPPGRTRPVRRDAGFRHPAFFWKLLYPQCEASSVIFSECLRGDIQQNLVKARCLYPAMVPAMVYPQSYPHLAEARQAHEREEANHFRSPLCISLVCKDRDSHSAWRPLLETRAFWSENPAGLSCQIQA